MSSPALGVIMRNSLAPQGYNGKSTWAVKLPEDEACPKPSSTAPGIDENDEEAMEYLLPVRLIHCLTDIQRDRPVRQSEYGLQTHNAVAGKPLPWGL